MTRSSDELVAPESIQKDAPRQHVDVSGAARGGIVADDDGPPGTVLLTERADALHVFRADAARALHFDGRLGLATEHEVHLQA